MKLLDKTESVVTEVTYTLADDISPFYYKEWLNDSGHVIDSILRDKDGYAQSVKRADEERTKLVSTLNQATNNKTDFYRSLVEHDAAMRDNANEGRKKEYWDHRNDFINKSYQIYF